jgi:hypothetical protein
MQVCSPPAFQPSFAALSPTLMKQLNFSNALRNLSSLIAVLVSSNLLQCGINGCISIRVHCHRYINDFCASTSCCSANSQKPQHPLGESQGQSQSSSLQTQPAVASTSTTPPTATPDTHTTTPGAGTVQTNLLSLLARLVLFLCCAPHTRTDGH